MSVGGAMLARLAAIVCLLPVCASLSLSETLVSKTGAVNVYLRPSSNISPAVTHWMQDESSLLMRSAGYQVRWLDPLARPDAPGTSLIVIELTGTCAPAERSGGPVDVDRLAFTVVDQGKILPFVSVDCTALQKTLASDLGREPRARRDVLYGRAMGRLVAHEMYHIESQNRGHSKHGVAEATVSSRELLSERFDFAGDALARIQVPVFDAEGSFDTVDADESAAR
jgi:hypothetical protein